MKYDIKDITGYSNQEVLRLIGEINLSMGLIENDVSNISDINIRPETIDSLFFNRTIPQIPSTFLVSGYSETIPSNTTEHKLELIPSDILLVTISGYTVTANSPSSSNEVQLSGRNLIFYSPTQVDLVVTYSGNVPSTYGESLYEKYILPDINYITNGYIQKPIVTSIGTDTYDMIVEEVKRIDGLTGASTLPLPYILPSFIQDKLGTSAHLDTKYVVLISDQDGEFSKVNLDSFTVSSSNHFVFSTKDEIDLTKTFIVLFAGESVESDISKIYSVLRNHSHSKDEFDTQIDHGDILSEEDKDYHPQYLLKTGYNYTSNKNGITGDIFISSKDAVNGGSNINDNSYKIVFGITTGPSIFRDNTFDGIHIDGSNGNGLRISVDTPVNSAKKILDAGGLLLTQTNDSSENYYSITTPYLLKLNSSVFSKDMLIKDLSIQDDGKLSMYGTTLSKVGTNLVLNAVDNNLVLKGKIVYGEGTFDGITVNNLTLSDTGTIKFKNGQIKNGVDAPMIDKLSFSDFSKVSSVSNSYETPTVSSNVMAIESDGEIIALNKVKSQTTINGKQYSFRETISGYTRIDTVDQWPKQKMSMKSISVDASTYSEKEGVKIGSNSRIYSSELDESCSTKALVIETSKSVIFLNASSSNACSDVTFADISVGDILSSGNGTFTSISVNDNADITTLSTKTLSSKEASFTKMTVADSLSTSTITVGDSATVGILTVRDISTTGNISVKGDIQAARIGSDYTYAKTGAFDSISSAKISASSTTTDSLTSGVIKAGDISSNSVSSGDMESSSGIIGSLKSDTILSTDISSEEGSINTFYTKKLNVSGDGRISGSMIVEKDFSALSSIVIKGELSVTGAATFNDVIMRDIDSSSIISKDITTGGMSVSENLNVSKNLVVEGKIYAGSIDSSASMSMKSLSVEKISVSGEISGSSTAQVSLGNLTISTITVNGKDGENIFFNDTTFNKNITAKGQSYLSKVSAGLIELATDDSKTSITSDSIRMTGGSSVIETAQMVVNSVSGKSEIDATELAGIGSTVSGQLVLAVTKSKFTSMNNVSVENILYAGGPVIMSGTLYVNDMKYIGTNEYVDIVSSSTYYD